MRLLLPAGVLVLLALSCSGGQTELRPSTTAPPPCPAPGAQTTPAPPPPTGAEGTLRPVKAREDVPLSGFRVDAKPGDWMLTHADSVAVVSAEGKIVDFGPTGGRDELGAITPQLIIALSAKETEVRLMEAVGEGGRVLHIERVVHGKPLVLHNWVYFAGGALRLVTQAAATGDDPALAVTLGERVGWGNVPTWIEGHGFVNTAGIFPTDFLARESLGVAYAFCSDTGRTYAHFGPPELDGLYQPAHTGEDVVLVPPGGVSTRRAVSLTYSMQSLGDAVRALPCEKRGPQVRVRLPAGFAPGARPEVARCGPGGSAGRPYALFGATPPGGAGQPQGSAAREIDLPEGCLRIRLLAHGHAPGAWLAPEALVSSPDALPRAGRLKWKATELGHPVPARVLVRGRDGTPDPHWGDDAEGGAAINVIFSDTGEGERPLPPGAYHVTVGRGFEYTAHEQDITIAEKKTSTIEAPITRVVATRGWIAADLHLHAVPSSDAPSRLADRVRSLAATGVEVAVATDHNAVTDYAPTIRELGLGARVARVIGDEVTTRDQLFGHFNVFPLAAGTPPIAWKHTLPSRIFAAARASQPHGAQTIVQVNHPRMSDIGYFDILRMDPADVAGWLARAPLADMSFDALEVFNGDHYANLLRVEQCLYDWYALLNAGFRTVATGNSDSHKVGFHEAGVPRTLVAMENDDPAAFDERAFVSAVRAGRVVVSSGPFVQLEAQGKPVGSTIGAGDVDIVVRVDAPPWVDVDRVELYRRGALLRTWAVKPDEARPLERRTREPLAKGDWIIAIARGSKPMTFLHRPNAFPMGFTNPIWAQ